MKIGFDAKRLASNSTGLGTYSRLLVEGLNNFSDAELVLFSPIQIKNPLFSKLKTYLKNSFLMPSSIWRSFFITQQIIESKVDIYHGLSHEIPLNIKQARQIKKIVTIHDLIYKRFPSQFSFIDRIAFEIKYRISAKNADMIIAISEQTKRDLIEFWNIPESKIVVHYQPVSNIYFQKLDPIELKKICDKYTINRPFWLYVGTVSERKNVAKLIKAFAQSKSRETMDLVIVGRGKEYLEQCKMLVDLLKIKDKIHFLENVPSTDLPALYQASFSFVYPSIFEGWGIPVIEAQASGKVVITSDGSSLREAAGEHSVLINPTNDLEITMAMNNIYSDINLRNKLENISSIYAQNFTLEKTTEKLLKIYQSLLS